MKQAEDMDFGGGTKTSGIGCYNKAEGKAASILHENKHIQ